jgi:hypothetical protein
MAWYRNGYGDGFEFRPYVSAAKRRSRALAAAEKVARKQKRSLAPVGPLAGTKLVSTFWGKAWCENLESYRDYENRLPRGRSYVRHGAVIDLRIEAGRVAALVSGTSTYEVSVRIRSLPVDDWRQLAAECTRQIDSLVDLLRGKLSAEIMERVTRKSGGLFPAPKEISFECSCPDWAGMCKHVAAALYGVGIRLEEKPELLFHLRGVDHTELVGSAADAVPRLTAGGKGRKVIEGADLSALFGIDLESPPPEPSPLETAPKPSLAKRPKRAASAAKSRKSESGPRGKGKRRTKAG